jgi:pimeloyl-ACP methyl ester carboxylesterase
MVKELREALARHGIQKCVVAGHSFGTIAAGWMAMDLPQHVEQLVLINPVCFLLRRVRFCMWKRRSCVRRWLSCPAMTVRRTCAGA